ncbi:MAG TPA: hypothetical protein VL403_10505, partial [Candidatus Kryptonia bacterium]|nr:hypothetical protein [Candidatus Kryptonia bacterium]
QSLTEYVLRIVAVAAVTAGPAAVASGAVMAALWAAWGGHGGAARPLGDLSAANTIGGVAGAVTAGFVAIPLLGVRETWLIVAVSYLILADIIANGTNGLKPLAYAALVAIVIVNPMRIPLVNLRPDSETLRAMLEGPSGIVTVVETADDVQLRLDNYYVLGGSAAATNERRLGLIPLLLHPGPRRAAFIGLATGITASAGPALGLDETTAIEIVPEVAKAARAYFSAWNARLLEQPSVTLVVDDGRRYLGAGREQYDAIVSDLFVPWHAGAGSLYSREMYQTVRRRLAANGLFCQWLPLYQLTHEEFDMIARTFLSVFPHVSLWRADFYPNRPVVGLVGQVDAQPIDLEQVSRRVDRMPDWARDSLLAAPRGFVMLYVGDLSATTDLFAGAPLNTDDRPRLEFLAPRLTRMNADGDKDWFTGDALTAFYDTLDSRMSKQANPFVGDADSVIAARRAGTALYKYALAATRHDDAWARHWQAQVSELVPEVIANAQSAAPMTEPTTDLTDARRGLADLRERQREVRSQLDVLEHRLKQLSNAEGLRQ